MRLTNYLREAFVRAAMNDVPQEDYDSKIREIAVQDAIKQMPKVVQTAYKKHPEYFANTSQYVGSRYVYAPFGHKKLSAEAKEEIEKLSQLEQEQRTTYRSLEQKLMSIAKSVTTRKALKEALPEFEKYLPAEKGTYSKNVPAITNVVADFLRAGWPKDQQKNKASAKKQAQETINKVKEDPPAVIAL